MAIDCEQFRVGEGERVDLDKRATRVKPVYRSHDDYRTILDDHRKRLNELQSRLYADGRYAVLFILQAMDAAGKDGVISHVMSGFNPQGVHVFSFAQPVGDELKHDFLWRTSRCLPERGRIGIFNRSYYEEVLIVRVHPELLRAEGVAIHTEGDVWEERFRSIRGLERHLHRNDTRIVKFFLQLSKEEQRRRFLARIDDPEKNWKLSHADISERAFWDDYMRAYEECLSVTSSKDAPWYVVPADDKPNERLIVSQIVLKTLEALDLRYPEATLEKCNELTEIRKRLEADK